MNRPIALIVALMALAGSVLTVAPAPAATLTDRNSEVEIIASPDGLISWTVDGVDHVHQQAFWFRTSPTAPEASIATLVLAVEVAHDFSATYIWAGSGLEVFIHYALTGGLPGSGESRLDESAIVTNTSGGPINLSWFEYTDFDLNLFAPGDTGEILAVGSTRQTQGGTVAAIDILSGALPTHFEIAGFGVIKARLDDASPTTLTDCCSPLGPADIEQAFQWNVTLPDGAALEIGKRKLIFTRALAVPTPGALVYLGAAFAAVAAISGLRRHSSRLRQRYGA